MANKNNNSSYTDIKYIKLAFEQAIINLGSTSSNPSVGCVVVKNNSVISSGCTSLNGRPHAESNALKKIIDYKNADLYVSLEPCSHYGKTPPCIDKIIKKKIKRVIFSVADTDIRSKNKAEKKLIYRKISVKKNILKNFGNDFYQSYFLQSLKQLPFIDAKLAISNDIYTINRKAKWITNFKSRRLGNFIRSKYDCLVTTSKTINEDNPLLDCRIESMETKTPQLIVIDRNLSLKRNSKIFTKKKRKVFILTETTNLFKENFFKKKGVKIIKVPVSKDKNYNLRNIFYIIKKLGFNRILIESGLTFIGKLLENKLIKNFYLFKSSKKLNLDGYNNSSFLLAKKVKISKKSQIKVNLIEDTLYKVKL